MEEFSREELEWTENLRIPEPEGALMAVPTHFVSCPAVTSLPGGQSATHYVNSRSGMLPDLCSCLFRF